MERHTINKEMVRDQLRKERNLLLNLYDKNPMETSFAIEIKCIDDQVAELTEFLDEERKAEHLHLHR